MYLNCRDLGLDEAHEVSGKDEREVMRNFISYAESELRMPVLTADTIYRVGQHIRR